jgi:hypothetical protein
MKIREGKGRMDLFHYTQTRIVSTTEDTESTEKRDVFVKNNC